MGTAGRSAPLRRAGSLLGLLGLELAAVVALHWLGRFPGLRIRWDQPVPWVLSSPVQEVLGSVLRTVGLVMAYWLLASTVLYLLASLTRLPSAVRAVGWATLPLARRVADHAVAVTLATSMVGGTTLGVAGPALAADRGGGMGPPARKPVAAAQATTTTAAYGFELAGPGAADQTTSSTAGETTTTTKPSTTTTDTSTTTTSESTTTATSESTTTTATTAPSTTATTQPTTTTAGPSAGRPARPAYEFEGAGQGTAPPTTTAAPTSSATTTTSTTELRPPAYDFTLPPAPGAREAQGDAGSGGGGDQGAESSGGGGDTGGGSSGGGGSGGGSSGGGSSGGGGTAGEERSGNEQEQDYRVQRGDNLWTIARDHLRSARSGGSGEPTNREVAEYWAKVVEANRNGLRSGDPDLIYPDEKIDLPPTD
jgi:uncharacterized membrane protein YgcG